MRFTAPLSVALADPNAEAVRKNVDQRIREVQDLPSSSVRVIGGVSLANAVETPIPHGLGRAPSFVTVSVPSGGTTPGLISEFRDTFSSGSPIDRSKIVVLRADGYGGAITVDVVVM